MYLRLQQQYTNVQDIVPVKKNGEFHQHQALSFHYTTAAHFSRVIQLFFLVFFQQGEISR
jgi:hypothetical protein